MIDIKTTLLSQYANSPVILSIIENMNEAIDPSADIDAFYNLVWNVDTAQSYGLDVWGRIVGVNRVLQLPSGEYLGFQEGGTIDYDPFNQSPFYYGGTTTSNYYLSDDAFRALILTKALSNISDCSIKTYNRILMQLFPNRGNAYVTDIGNMFSNIHFNFDLQPFEVAIIKQSGAFSNPTGVGFNLIIDNIANYFGFAESGIEANGFNQGNFFSGAL